MQPDFGPPRFAPLAFAWALAQPIRAVFWQLRFAELRGLAVRAACVTFAVGGALLTAALFTAAPLQALLMRHGEGLLAGASWFAVRVVIHLVLALAALLATVQLQGAIAQAISERMSLFVQRRVTGDAPEPRIGKRRVLLGAARALFPTLASLLLWLLTAVAAAGLVLVPAIGPVLVVPVQLLVCAAFLARSAVAQVRGRLALPRRLWLREPACMLGLAVGFIPYVMFPPLTLVGTGAISIGGTLVGLGIQRRSRKTEAALDEGARNPEPGGAHGPC